MKEAKKTKEFGVPCNNEPGRLIGMAGGLNEADYMTVVVGRGKYK